MNSTPHSKKDLKLKTVSLTLLLACITTTAMAVEVVVPAASPSTPSSSSSQQPKPCPCPKAFQGFYVGGNVGYGTGTLRATQTVTLLPTTQVLSEDLKVGVQGFDGGALIGYTYIFSNNVGLGLEGYFNWTTTHGSTVISSDSNPVMQHSFFLQNSAQLRVPVSYVIADLVAPKVMLGWDNSKWISEDVREAGRGIARCDTRYNGFLWGCGVDFLIAKQFISGIEYTGVLSQNVTYTDYVSSTLTSRPIYNKFAWTIKYIF